MVGWSGNGIGDASFAVGEVPASSGCCRHISVVGLYLLVSVRQSWCVEIRLASVAMVTYYTQTECGVAAVYPAL
jgi:hypothetical protein